MDNGASPLDIKEGILNGGGALLSELVKEEIVSPRSNGSGSGNEARSTEAMAGFAGSVSRAVGSGGALGAGGAVGRLVDTSHADDRRLIRLVRARPLLYVRNNMPVASYYSQCKLLWQEVADNMGRSVAEVRRKWSHIRNSYSRHLRNEVLGARTGRGRSVSRWYLAPELDFLRDHMATDTRSVSLGQYTASPDTSGAETESTVGSVWGGGGGGEGGGGGGHSPLWAGAAGDSLLQPKVEAVYAQSEDSAGSFGGDEGDGGCGGDGDGAGSGGGGDGSLAAFFRPLQHEWAGLSARRRRLYLRQSLALLHALLDEQDAENTTQQHTYGHSILPSTH